LEVNQTIVGGEPLIIDRPAMGKGEVSVGFQIELDGRAGPRDDGEVVGVDERKPGDEAEGYI
jgi:hypothetical protein